jgi:hypothetical protein
MITAGVPDYEEYRGSWYNRTSVMAQQALKRQQSKDEEMKAKVERVPTVEKR